MLSPLKTIRKKCLECSLGNMNEVKLCPVVECALYVYRLGKHPKLQGKRKISGDMTGLNKWKAEQRAKKGVNTSARGDKK